MRSEWLRELFAGIDKVVHQLAIVLVSDSAYALLAPLRLSGTLDDQKPKFANHIRNNSHGRGWRNVVQS